MRLREAPFIALLVGVVKAANATSPGNAPPLPITGVRIVNVSTELQLQTAMGNLQSGDTILLADGTYNLTKHPLCKWPQQRYHSRDCRQHQRRPRWKRNGQ